MEKILNQSTMQKKFKKYKNYPETFQHKTNESVSHILLLLPLC